MLFHFFRAFALVASAAGLTWVAIQTASVERIVLAATVCLLACIAFILPRISAFLRMLFTVFATEALLLSALLTAPVYGIDIGILGKLGLELTHAIGLALFAAAAWPLNYIPVFARIFAFADPYIVSDQRIALTWLRPLRLSITERTFFATALTAVILVGQIDTGLIIWIAQLSGKVLTALRDKDTATFWSLVAIWLPLLFLFFAVLNLAADVVQQSVEMRWERFLSTSLISRWIGDGRQYRLAMIDRTVDNPDQRIHADIAALVSLSSPSSPYGLIITLAKDISALVAVALILWRLSDNLAEATLGLPIPGLLVWLALVWNAIPALAIYLLSKPLSAMTWKQVQTDANYRFGLSRVREYAEQIALLDGSRAEIALGRERLEIANWRGYIAHVYTSMVTTVQMNFLMISAISSNFVVAPFYFAGIMDIGRFTEVAGYFARTSLVANAFVLVIQLIPIMRTFEARVGGLLAALLRVEQATPARPIVEGDTIRLDNVELLLPDGKRLSQPLCLEFARGNNVLVMGPSGAGKSTLLRALSGVWPFQRGTVRFPEGASILTLPQAPYIPMGSLVAALAYPAQAAAYPLEEIRRALIDVELPQLASRLEDHDENWALGLSGGERQRLSIARALLTKPQWLLLDEATSAMDIELEQRMYDLLRRRLPDTTLISVGHRDSLVKHHPQQLVAVPDRDAGLRFDSLRSTPPAATGPGPLPGTA